MKRISFYSHCKFSDKKGVSLDLKYDPKRIETEICRKWPKVVLNHEKCSKGSTIFSLLLPPPNITGTLHLGHALTVTCQDIISRWKRMCGCDVLWVPGLDHAGIATQAVVEKNLSSKGRFIKEMSDKQLLAEIQLWSKEKSEVIRNQLSRLGASLDWSREFFTLDKRQCDAVTEAFKILWHRKLIYRGNSLVNWSTALGSSISDIEVNHLKITGPTKISIPGYDAKVLFGSIYDIAFLVEDKSSEEIVVSTTRPETMFGDVCICVNPNDSRYSQFIDKFVIHPLTGQKLPVIADSVVDPDFGTGALKVTPAHDWTDFDLGKKHNLPIISVIGEDGLMNNHAGSFEGLKRFNARSAVIQFLSEKNLLRGVKDHEMDLPICSRSSDVIELLPKPQWFLNCSELAKRVLDKVEKGELLIEPSPHVKTFLHFMENIRDWCLSRQVVWGHPIPLAWSKSNQKWVYLDRSLKSRSPDLVPDTDVLDTWFSSGLLPFSVFGWPQQTEDLEKYYPLSKMITGHDILFFWVARMAMLGIGLTGKLPFYKVLLHGIICDSEGKKMSKSVGNVIDPLHVIDGISLENILSEVTEKYTNGKFNKEEADAASQHFRDMFPQGIPECGTDALRMSLVSNRIQDNFVEFDLKNCISNKFFCNKLWQATRYILTSFDQLDLEIPLLATGNSNFSELALACGIVEASAEDQWLASHLINTINDVNRALQDDELHIALNAIKGFLLNDFCAVYIECSKPVIQGSDGKKSKLCARLMLYCMLTSVKLLAPFMPYLSDKLFSLLQPESKLSVHSMDYPSASQLIEIDNKEVEMFNLCLEISKEIRRLKSEMNLPSKTKVAVQMSKQFNLKDFVSIISLLSKCNVKLKNSDSEINLDRWKLLTVISSDVKIYFRNELVQSGESVDQMAKKKEKLQSELSKILKMMDHQSYDEKVSDSVKKFHQDKVTKIKTELLRLQV